MKSGDIYPIGDCQLVIKDFELHENCSKCVFVAAIYDNPDERYFVPYPRLHNPVGSGSTVERFPEMNEFDDLSDTIQSKNISTLDGKLKNIVLRYP